MPITAYSKTFKRELDSTQLTRLFNEHEVGKKISFRDFVKEDIECPACNATGGHYVNESVSSTGKVIKQAYFAFRDAEGNDAHLPFCDFYNGPDKQNTITNEGQVDFSKSNSPITQAVAWMVCCGIENSIFSQEDIRNMRQWFLELRQNGDFTFEVSPHLVNITRAFMVRNKRNSKEYTFDANAIKDECFDINQEVYESLHYKFPQLAPNFKDNSELYNLRLLSVLKKSRSIAVKESNSVTFDRTILSDKYAIARIFALEIRKANPRLRSSMSHSIPAVSNSNPLMALSALLLFVSDWENDKALNKLTQIMSYKTINDHNAGNVMGLNPFIHYNSWVVVKKLHELQQSVGDGINFDLEFENEKNRLLKLYYPITE
ncbi:hypothetical protein [Rahnella bonaserana]|uniref:Uncharacterized protein n=1 Tax=Rahnella bonaserana TaxID=2816248 RepID=A0ABS6LQN1_9GAMM|nr:hypothetical protein [Rahnella bonaserana]MBU9854337.1 hypothetical protein [Rahnella bonaserana]